MESNTLMEIERWSVTRGSGSRAGKGIDAAHAASRLPPPMRSVPARMDVLHSPYCAASASREVPHTDASTRHAPAPVVPHALSPPAASCGSRVSCSSSGGRRVSCSPVGRCGGSWTRRPTGLPGLPLRRMAGRREEAWIWERSSGRAAARLHDAMAGGCCRVSSSGEWRAEVRWDGFGKGALGGQRRAALDEICERSRKREAVERARLWEIWGERAAAETFGEDGGAQARRGRRT